MTDDFGRCLEAAISAEIAGGGSSYVLAALARFRDAVRAANTRVSAPAKGAWTDGGKCYEESPSGAGADLVDAMRSLRFCIQTPGLNISAMLKAAQCRALLSHIESLERDAERRDEIVRTSISELSWFRKNLPENLRETFDQDLNYLSAARKEGK